MGKKIIKAVVLMLIFFASLAGLSMLTDRENVDLTSEMKEASLPVILLKKGDISINQLFGYKGEMEEETIRETVTPLSADMVLPVTIQTYKTHVEEISYEVRTMDLQRLLEHKQIEKFSQKDGVIQTKLRIQNLLEEGQEYRLRITLKCGGQEVRYYTRLIRPGNWHVDDAIQFALDFHHKTFDPAEAAQLALYLEPNVEGDNTTLHKVTIHSSLNQVAWGSFEGEALMDPIPSVWEVGSSFNTVKLNYVMAATGDNGETEFYNVEEFYRTRYSEVNDRLYLLDYERTMSEIFRGSGAHASKSGLLLGIRDMEVSYSANENGTIVSFVQEGDLWSYNSVSNQLSLVFSFRGIEGINDRENNGSHSIRIMKVSEEGNIDFAVYGYMNRGAHEGYTGVGVYHYDCVANTIQEDLFIQSGQPYEWMKETWGKLFFISDDGYFYMLAESELYKIRLEDCSVEVMRSQLDEENFAASADGRYIAWLDPKENGAIAVTDLDTERQWQITGKKGEALRLVGFVESDLVYGVAEAGETAAAEDFPMHRLVIVDKEQQVIKEYEKSGYYITKAYVESSTVFLERAARSGDIFTPVQGDAIKSHEIEAARNIQVGTIVTEQKQTQVKLVLEQELAAKTPQTLVPQEVVLGKKNTVSLKSKAQEERYTVYDAGKILLRTKNEAQAIQTADAAAGVVLAQPYRYLWRRGRTGTVSLAERVVLSQEEADQTVGDMMLRCLMALLKAEGISFDVSGPLSGGETPARIMQEAMPSAQVLNLTGCSVSQVLYYISQGGVVFAWGENQQPMLLVGYDEHNVILYDPVINSTYRKGLSDSEEYFSQAGNAFLGYLKDGNLKAAK